MKVLRITLIINKILEYGNQNKYSEVYGGLVLINERMGQLNSSGHRYMIEQFIK